MLNTQNCNLDPANFYKILEAYLSLYRSPGYTPTETEQEKMVDTSCQVWFNLAKEFERRRFF
jgi:hypothetical protein